MQAWEEGRAGSRWRCLHRGKQQDRSGTPVEAEIQVLLHRRAFHNHGPEEKSKKPLLKAFRSHHMLYCYKEQAQHLALKP